LEESERDELKRAMAAQVLPVMEGAIRKLNLAGFTQVRVEQHGGMASLFAACEKPPVEARLRFQIHDTFAPLVTREPVFWMMTIYNGNEIVTGVPGRMSGFEDARVIANIVDDFVRDCASARGKRDERCATYFTDVITSALDGLPFQRPLFSAESIRISQAGGGECLRAAVAPVVEIARQCLATRFTGWLVESHVPSATEDGSGDCRLRIKTLTMESTLRFFTQSLRDGLKICCETITDGKKSPSRTIQVLPRNPGQVTRTEAVEEVLGEFMHRAIALTLTGHHRLWEAGDVLVMDLARLRANAVLVAKTSGGKSVSENDVTQLDALAAGMFGFSLDRVDYFPADSISRLHIDLGEAGALLPEGEGATGQAFVTDLQRRVQEGLL
jgi:hypothetical protein